MSFGRFLVFSILIVVEGKVSDEELIDDCLTFSIAGKRFCDISSHAMCFCTCLYHCKIELCFTYCIIQL